MRYTGITGIIRITCITSIIRTYVRPRWNRPGAMASSFSDSLFASPTLPVSRLSPRLSLGSLSSPYLRTSSFRLILLFYRPPSSRDSSYSPHFSSSLLFSVPLLSYLFTLRLRASGRFNVRDFFSPSLVPAPFSLLSSSSFSSLASITLPVPPKLHSCALRDVRAQQCISRLCNRAPRSTKLRIVIFIATFFLKLFAQKSRIIIFLQ